jgi:hypothetical protein
MSLPFVNLVIQRGKADCGIASLAMLLGLQYEDVFAVAITKKYPSPHHRGMYSRQIIATAKRLGTTLTLRRTWDLESSCGLLTVEKTDKQPDEFAQHLVLLKFGLIFDTDGIVWECDDYFRQLGFRPVSIFVEG